MSAITASFRKDMAKILLYPLLSLFLIPALAYLFVWYAMPEFDKDIIGQIDTVISQDAKISAEEAKQRMAFIRKVPPSQACGISDPKQAGYREMVCSRDDDLWQFYMVGRVSFWLLAGGAAALLTALLLGAVAFLNRRAQYVSFMLGWRLLGAFSAVGIIAQGALLVWLSYWVTVFFDQSYYPKIVIGLGVLVAIGAFRALVAMFRRSPRSMQVEGELVSEADAPALWTHVRQTAERLETRAPDHIIAGIDDNFFVTETPIALGNRIFEGRSLFISIPLLRILERGEADAVLAHELAHFSGGDTASSARLSPMLYRYDRYCQTLGENFVTLVVYPLMRLYRVIFEFALQRDSRAREFLADRAAAALASARAIVHSLVKIAAYAQYRNETENRLFEHNALHSENIGIASLVASGLNDYALSPRFVQDMRTANVPHPFDTHPPLRERMANVDCTVEEQAYGGIAASAPAASWVDDISSAPAIEQRLWAEYEKAFAATHELQLAYRYVPANDEERAIVLKHFPGAIFELGRGKRLEVNYAGLLLPGEGELLPWQRISKMEYTDAYLSDILTITHPEKGLIGKKTSKVKLPGARKHRDAIKAALNRYYGRHMAMQQYQAANKAQPAD